MLTIEEWYGIISLVADEAANNFIIKSCAGMAELADAKASGACRSNIVRVQVPLPALFFYADLFSHVSIYHTLPLVQIIQLFTQYPFRIPVHVFLT